MVGQEDQRDLLLGIVDFHPAQPVRALGRRVHPREADDLVPPDLTALRRRAPLDDVVEGVVLEAGDEEDLPRREVPQPRVVDVAAVHDENGPRVEAQGTGHPHVVPLAVGDDGHAGQVPVVIQQQVECDRALGAPKLGPVEQRGAQIDHGRIQAHELVLEPELPAAPGQGLAAGQQLVEDRAIELPRPMLIGIGQCRPRRRLDPQVAQFALAAGQAPADLAQRVGPSQLAEEHRYELAPAREAPRMTLRMGTLDEGLEFGPRKQVEKLAEHARKSTHG